ANRRFPAPGQGWCEQPAQSAEATQSAAMLRPRSWARAPSSGCGLTIGWIAEQPERSASSNDFAPSFLRQSRQRYVFCLPEAFVLAQLKRPRLPARSADGRRIRSGISLVSNAGGCCHSESNGAAFVLRACLTPGSGACAV